MKNIATVRVHAEANTNCDWEITFKDGTVLSYYSIDQGSPQSSTNDERLYDSDPKLASFLQELWYNMGVDDDDTEATEATFDHTGKLLKTWETN